MKTVQKAYGCLMAYPTIDVTKWNQGLSYIDKKDVYMNDNYGYEYEPHVTILYGFELDKTKTKDVEASLNNFNKFNIEVVNVSSFTNKVYDVLKFDVKSSTLSEMNNYYKDNFEYENDYPTYHPHMTICYLMPDTADKYIEKFKKMMTFPITLEVQTIKYSEGYNKYSISKILQ